MSSTIATNPTTNHGMATSSRGWNAGLWLLQVALAGMFLMAGVMKTTTPIAELALMMPWVAEAPALIRFIGASEILGAIGLILPTLLRIRPELTQLAAWSLALVMLLAIGFHVARGEFAAIGTNVLLAAAAALVAWGRSTRAPIAARG